MPSVHNWKGANGPPSRSQGDTFEEARATVQEAIELYLETLTKEETTERLSHEVITASLEIAIA